MRTDIDNIGNSFTVKTQDSSSVTPHIGGITAITTTPTDIDLVSYVNSTERQCNLRIHSELAEPAIVLSVLDDTFLKIVNNCIWLSCYPIQLEFNTTGIVTDCPMTSASLQTGDITSTGTISSGAITSTSSITSTSLQTTTATIADITTRKVLIYNSVKNNNYTLSKPSGPLNLDYTQAGITYKFCAFNGNINPALSSTVFEGDVHSSSIWLDYLGYSGFKRTGNTPAYQFFQRPESWVGPQLV
jgi:hypothetical protein